VVPGLELLQEGQIKAEFDYVFVSGQEVFAGECKAGDSLGDKDEKTARLAAALGISHFYFCTIRTFDQTSNERIEGLRAEFTERQQGMTLDVLDGKALLGEAIE
jgi:hypothetical protein